MTSMGPMDTLRDPKHDLTLHVHTPSAKRAPWGCFRSLSTSGNLMYPSVAPSGLCSRDDPEWEFAPSEKSILVKTTGCL